MDREFLKGLELDKETIDTIMAEHGKKVQAYKEQIDSFKEQVSKLEESSKVSDADMLELQTLRQEKEEAKAKAEDETFTERVTKAFGDSQFINELTKEALISKMKNAIKDDANIGKSDKEIFESLTKDQDNIFVNPNKPADIPPMGEAETQETKTMPMFW